MKKFIKKSSKIEDEHQFVTYNEMVIFVIGIIIVFIIGIIIGSYLFL